ncbi:MAG: pyridoxine 5'-phosphate synthase [Holophagales bacterium]|jgi:pyridoxine 5-phosphate synthase|nr:pyridoxine 5'-phosphate synthase [Holophagales bacterium]
MRLGVNIDHVATLRQARGGHEPDPVTAALAAQSAGAHSITVHLRQDRRHIQERDVRLLKEMLSIPLNVECAATPESLETVVSMRPLWVTLVPETREELTTQGGLDVAFLQSHLRQMIRDYHASEIRVSIFVDAVAEQVKTAAKLEADAVEFNTGPYTDLPLTTNPDSLLAALKENCRLASRLELGVLAGHGLNLRNVGPIASVPEIMELNIGHSIVARSVFVGIEQAVREMLKAIREPDIFSQ